MTSYIAILHKETASDFGVSFPDFPGCVTAGATLEEARAMAGEALVLHMDGMIEDGVAFPAPSTLDAVMADPDFRDGVAFLVDTPASDRVVRVNITLPEELVRRIDRVSRNRSRFLAEAARQKLNEPA